MVLARNTVSGQIADVSPKMLNHPAFKNILEVVDTGAKPYLPEMFYSGTVEERKKKRSKKESEAPEQVDEINLNEED